MLPSGNASTAAVLKRSGVSGRMLSGADIFGDVFSCRIAASRIWVRNEFTVVDFHLGEREALATAFAHPRTLCSRVRPAQALGPGLADTAQHLFRQRIAHAQR